MNKDVILIGLNHKTAPVEVRERYALDRKEGFSLGLVETTSAEECLTLSTCNRVEILAVGRDTEALFAQMDRYWAEVCGGSTEELSPHVYRYTGLEAARHVFQVAASLDSLVLGEPQILGQLKDAYRLALKQGTARIILNRLLHKAFFTAKKVRTETNIASSAVSISYAAVELAKRIFGDISNKTAMLVGAGEMAELAATHFLNSGMKKLLIANRTLSRAEELARCMNGTAVPFEEMAERLAEADVVVSSTGASSTVIRAREVKEVLKRRKYRPMFFIDIAVPRDVDPDVNLLDNVYLYDIDDLKEVVEENMAQRQDEAVRAQELIDQETLVFGQWLKSLELQPTIVALFDKGEDLALKELDRTLKRLGDVDDEERKALETLVLSVARKVLHDPVTFLKRRYREEESAGRYTALVRRIFHLDEEEIPENAHRDRELDGDE